MGEARNKRQRFLAEHSICCFCGGNTPAVSVDHIPARTCFVGRQFPEGFEFPACEACQVASRKDELAFAFYVRALDRDPANFDGEAWDQRITGLANNLPHLLPNPYLNARRKRDTLKRMGHTKPLNMATSELPVIEINPELHERFDRYARKMAAALFYREQARIAPADYKVLANWGQTGDLNFMAGAKGFVEMTPLIVHGTRTNVKFGTQFGYRCNKADKPDVFAVLAWFGDGVVLQMLLVEPSFEAQLDTVERAAQGSDLMAWTRLGDNYRP